MIREESLTPAVRDAFAESLVHWYREHHRDLPWRHRADDPYAVWVSEIMLQQTQVATVIPFYTQWMARFPTLQTLAEAPLDEVLRHWAGLGYYARARNLHHAAQIVREKHDGIFPSDASDIAALPGIGRYTAGAVRSIAFRQPAPIVDANVIRVLTRVFAVEGNPKSGVVQARLWHLAEALIPPTEARDFNQAMMELGALVCSPAEPACERCPLLAVCRAGNSADPTAYPQFPPGKATVRVTHCSALLSNLDDLAQVLVVQRPPHGLWGGLWEFPRRVAKPGESPADCAARAAQEVVGLEAQIGERLETVRHGVTHHAVTLHGFLAHSPDEPAACDCDRFAWVTEESLADYPLASPQALLAAAWKRHREEERQGRRQDTLF